MKSWSLKLGEEKICFHRFPLIQNLQGVPKQSVISIWQAIEGIRSGLQKKVGRVLENSGNFLSDEHKTPHFCEKKGPRKTRSNMAIPPKKWDHLGSPCITCAHLLMLTRLFFTLCHYFSIVFIDHFQCKARAYFQKYYLTFLGHPLTSIQMISNK